MENSKNVLGKRLGLAREKIGLSLQQVCERTGIGVSSLSEFENGRREPRLSQLEPLAELYRRTLSFLLGEEPIEEEPILWRNRPEDRAEIEASFRELCRQYHNLESWLDLARPLRLPSVKGTPDNFGYSDARALAHQFRNTQQLGQYPARSLLHVLEEVCGVKVFHLELEPAGVAASTVDSVFGAAIMLNSAHVRWRRNFDLAHELFHVLTWDVFRHSGSDGEPECKQKLATCFARHLLMPVETFLDSLSRESQDNRVSLGEIANLAREFDVSVEAILWHMVIEAKLDSENAGRLIKKWGENFEQFEVRESSPVPERPERYAALAKKALRKGEISVGRFAKYMGISRQKAQRLWEREVADDEEVVFVAS